MSNGLVIYPCPLGDGRFAELRLPNPFTAQDYARVTAFLATLILPDPPSEAPTP